MNDDSKVPPAVPFTPAAPAVPRRRSTDVVWLRSSHSGVQYSFPAHEAPLVVTRAADIVRDLTPGHVLTEEEARALRAGWPYLEVLRTLTYQG